jgi:ATP-dependent Clp protease ATP-binding subunit ClpB
MKERVLGALREHFRPEFLNRIDETVVFHALTAAQLKYIVDLQINLLNKRLADRNIQLDLTEPARDYLARLGYDPVYGARPLKRLIQKDIENPLSLELLEGKFADGDNIVVDSNGDGLQFKKHVELVTTPKS